MTIAINPKATKVYVTKEDKTLPEPQRTKWTLANLTAEERAFHGNLSGMGDTVLYALHLGLVGVENFCDSNGNPVKLERDDNARVIVGKKRPWKAECMDLIPPLVADELAGQIMRGVQVSEEAAKNS